MYQRFRLFSRIEVRRVRRSPYWRQSPSKRAPIRLQIGSVYASWKNFPSKTSGSYEVIYFPDAEDMNLSGTQKNAIHAISVSRRSTNSHSTDSRMVQTIRGLDRNANRL